MFMPSVAQPLRFMYIKDVPHQQMIASWVISHLYTAGIARVHFTIPGFIYWILDGIVCANIAVWAPLLALQPEDGSLGVDGLAAVRIRQRTWHGIAATRTCLKPSAHCRPPP